jgi:hypothetical protein
MVEAGLGGIDSGSGAGGSFIAGNSNDSRTWIACAERDRMHELGWCYGRPNGPAPMNRRVCGERDRQRSASVDLPRRTARLADTKTGASLRPLSEAACAVISTQPRNGDVVFPSRSGETPIVGYRKMWSRIAKLDDLPADITPHALRHSFAGSAADLSYNKPTIATLLGHKVHSRRPASFMPSAPGREAGRTVLPRLWYSVEGPGAPLIKGHPIFIRRHTSGINRADPSNS